MSAQAGRAATAIRVPGGASALEQRGLGQRFAFTHELAWNVLKDFLQDKGFVDIIDRIDHAPLRDHIERVGQEFHRRNEAGAQNGEYGPG